MWLLMNGCNWKSLTATVTVFELVAEMGQVHLCVTKITLQNCSHSVE